MPAAEELVVMTGKAWMKVVVVSRTVFNPVHPDASESCLQALNLTSHRMVRVSIMGHSMQLVTIKRLPNRHRKRASLRQVLRSRNMHKMVSVDTRTI